VSEWFLHDHSLPASFVVIAVQQLGLVKSLYDFGKLAGGSRQIK
jgi:hypothetical protein